MAPGQTPENAAGNIIRGMTRQVGNELDEFVTDALRNRLLGLPLDLATLNIARARDTGIPSLNAARRSFYAESGNPALAPYSSWADFGFSMRNAASLVNFIAAYGTHPSITAGALGNATRRSEPLRRHLLDIAARRNTRRPGCVRLPNSTGLYASSPSGITTTGVDASTCGWAASPRSRWCSADCSARRSTTSSRCRWRTCRTVTGSTTCPAPPVSTCSPSSRATRSPSSSCATPTSKRCRPTRSPGLHTSSTCGRRARPDRSSTTPRHGGQRDAGTCPHA